jgi:hypothetical protein
MFPERYFPSRMFAPRYFPKVGADPAALVPGYVGVAVVDAEDRTASVPSEDRVVIVPFSEVL